MTYSEFLGFTALIQVSFGVSLIGAGIKCKKPIAIASGSMCLGVALMVALAGLLGRIFV